MKLKLDFDALSFGDLEDFEERIGADMMDVAAEMQKTGKAPMKHLIGLLWICGRSEDESYTYEDARKVKLAELKDLEVEVVKADPTAGDGSTS